VCIARGGIGRLLGVRPAPNHSRAEVRRAMQPLVSIRQVAARLGVHPRTVHRWIKAGVLPRPRRVGGRLVRWPAEEIDGSLKRAFPELVRTWASRL
jgi:excisionase family DNA binding protein